MGATEWRQLAAGAGLSIWTGVLILTVPFAPFPNVRYTGHEVLAVISRPRPTMVLCMVLAASLLYAPLDPPHRTLRAAQFSDECFCRQR